MDEDLPLLGDHHTKKKVQKERKLKKNSPDKCLYPGAAVYFSKLSKARARNNFDENLLKNISLFLPWGEGGPKNNTGRLRHEVRPLTVLYIIFRSPSIDKWYPFRKYLPLEISLILTGLTGPSCESEITKTGSLLVIFM